MSYIFDTWFINKKVHNCINIQIFTPHSCLIRLISVYTFHFYQIIKSIAIIHSLIITVQTYAHRKNRPLGTYPQTTSKVYLRKNISLMQSSRFMQQRQLSCLSQPLKTKNILQEKPSEINDPPRSHSPRIHADT